MELFVLWIAFSIMAACVASNKGRSGFGFFIFSLCLPPLIGFIGALIAKQKISQLYQMKHHQMRTLLLEIGGNLLNIKIKEKMN